MRHHRRASAVSQPPRQERAQADAAQRHQERSVWRIDPVVTATLHPICPASHTFKTNFQSCPVAPTESCLQMYCSQLTIRGQHSIVQVILMVNSKLAPQSRRWRLKKIRRIRSLSYEMFGSRA